MKRRVMSALLVLCLCLTLLPGAAFAAYEQPTEVSQVTLSVTPPAVGGALTAPTVGSNEPYFIDSDALFDSRFADTFYWNRVAAEGCTASAGYLYEEGGTSLVNDSWYRLHVRLKLDYGYYFAENVTAAVPGAAKTEVERYQDGTVDVSAWFKVGSPADTPTAVSTVTLTDVPTAREDEIETWRENIQNATVSEGCRISYVSLREWDSADSRWLSSNNSGSTDAGKIYGALLTINPLPNHVFADAVTATVNGSAAEVAECDIDKVVVFVPFGNVTVDTVEVKSAASPIDGDPIPKDADNFYLNDYFSDGSYPYTLKSARFQIEDGDSYRDLRDEETRFSGHNNYRVIAELEAKSYATFADNVTGDFNGTDGVSCEISADRKTCTVTRNCTVYDRVYTYSVAEPDNRINSVTIHQDDPQPGEKYADGEYAPSNRIKTKLVGIDTGTSYYSWDEVPCVGSTESLKRLSANDVFEDGKVYLYTMRLNYYKDKYRFGDGFTVSFAQMNGSKSNYAMMQCETDTEKRKVYNLWYTVGDVTQTPITAVAVTGPAYQNGSVDTSDPSAFHADVPVTLRTLTYNNNNNYLGFTLLPQSGHYFGRTVTVTYNGKEARVSDGFFSSFDTKYVGVSYSDEPTTPSSGGGRAHGYSVTAGQGEHGSVTVSPRYANKGDTVTITVKPDSGYVLETLTAMDKSGSELKLTDKGGGKYTFTMPGSKVEVKATFMEDNSILNFFYDVPNDSFYYEAVKWAAGKNIASGVGNHLFAPDLPCTRAQIVTFLWRAAGSPEPKNVGSFSDVPASAYYAKAVAWAVENGITTGTGDGMFSPDAVCTRAQAVSFLWRYEKVPVASRSNPFTDVAADSYYADAVLWAVKEDITKGTTNTTFNPNADCTRAQIVTFLWRCKK